MGPPDWWPDIHGTGPARITGALPWPASP